MKNRFFRAVTLMLAGVCMCAGCAACNPKAKATELPDYEASDAVLNIDAWLGPRRSEQAFKDYADCGYNIMHVSHHYLPIQNVNYTNAELNAMTQETFELAKKYGLKVVLGMNAENPSANSIRPFAFIDARIGETLEKWKDDDTFYGIMMSDENKLDKPLSDGGANGEKYMLKAYDRTVDFLRDQYFDLSAKYPGKFYENVLLGIKDSTDGGMGYFTTAKTFEEYTDCYYENVIKYMPLEDRVYSHDAYPFSESGGKLYRHDRFVGSLEAFAQLSERDNAKKVMYTQNHRNIYNTESVSYQYYTAMVFGYTHFVTYCYLDVWGEKQYSAAYGGQKTDNYYYYQAAHKEVRAMEKAYMNFAGDWLGALAYKGSERADVLESWSRAEHLLESYPRIADFKCTEDTLVGVMRDENGNDGFLISNQAMTDTYAGDTVTVKFNDANKAVVYMNGTKETVNLDGGKLTLDIKCGGGALVIPVKE